MTGTITTEKRKDGVVTVWLDRPEVKNALNIQMIQEMAQCLDSFANDSSVRVIVLRGTNSHFCAGADLKWMKNSVTQSAEENQSDAAELARLLETLDTFPTPTLAYVQGGAFGGGVGLLSCCDIVIADPKAVFSFSEVKLGLVPAMIAPYVVRRLGSHARRYLLTAEQFNGAFAQSMGLVHELAAPAQADKWLNYFVSQFLEGGPHALRTTKSLLRMLELIPPSKHQELTTQCIAEIRQGNEAQAGLKAFFDKAPPPWRKSDV